MTQDNTYQQPSLFINQKEILSDISGTINFPGNNQLNTLSVNIKNPYLQNAALYNKPIELFLNNGSMDSVPIFRGFIKSFSPSDNQISLQAFDVRSVLEGKNGIKITLTDEKNYDGFSLAQFLFSIVEENNLSYLKMDMLQDTNPPIFITGERGDNIGVYSLLKNKIAEALDTTTDFLHPLQYFIDVYEDSNYSNITFVKDKLLASTPRYSFSHYDGLISYKFTRRLPANTVHYKGGVFKYTNRPEGQINTTVEEKENPAETRNLALQNILLERQQTDEIKITVNKAFDVALGDIIFLDIDEEDIGGNHRVQSKSITFGNTTNCNISLNKKPIKLSDYISAA